MPPPVQRFDAIVIGAGQAGPSLAARLAGSGLKTALIEREHLGGTCVNDGCTPTKTMVASARTAFVARRAADYGVVIGGPITVDMKAVKARKDAVVKQSVDGLQHWLGNLAGLTLVRGHARFTGPDTIAVGDQTLYGDRFFLNVGARAIVPDWPGLAGVKFLTNSTMMDVDTLPAHLVVVGGSYIGLEFAQMFRRFGAEVTVIEHGERIIAREDPPVSVAVQQILADEGVRFVTGAGDFSVAARGGGIRLNLQVQGQARAIDGSDLLVAIGRKPNTDDLGLEHTAIRVDSRGYIEVDDRLQTSASNVWALGDANGRGAFTHTSYNDYEIVTANLLDSDPRSVGDRIPAYALYIDPPLARIGLNDAQARASGNATLAGQIPMTRVGRANERGETKGFMRVLVDAQSRRIVGATLLGIDCDEVIHALLDVMAAGAPYTVIQRCMHIHPTISELLPTLLADLKPL